MSLEFVITSLIVILIPGTGVIYTVATAMGRGRSAGIAAAFGCTLGIVPHIAASTLGLAAILHTSAVLFQVLKFCGAAYLLYLAWQTIRSTGPLRIEARDAPAKRARDTIATGFLINILNPKLSAFFLAFLPQFVSPNDPAGVMSEMAFLGGAFMLMTFAVFIVYCLFAAGLGRLVLESETVMRWMRRTVAAAFAGFGIQLAFANR